MNIQGACRRPPRNIIQLGVATTLQVIASRTNLCCARPEQDALFGPGFASNPHFRAPWYVNRNLSSPNPNISRAGRGGAAHGRAAGHSGDGQDGTPTGRFARIQRVESRSRSSDRSSRWKIGLKISQDS